MSRLLLVRHGESEWNVARRWQGHHDVPLTARGEEQAKRAAEQLRELLDGHAVHGVAASDLSRAHRTAEIIGSSLGIERVHMDARLRERHVGEWTGLTESEVRTRYPGMLERWRQNELERIPGGESNTEVLERTLAALSDLLAHHPQPAWIVAVTHGGVIRLIEQRFGVGAGRIGNLCGRWLHLEGDQLAAGEPFLISEG